MKNFKILFLTLALLLSVGTIQAKTSLTDKVHARWCTFNIRNQNSGDDKMGVGWNVRKDRVASYVLDNQIDVVGMQEVLYPQLKDIRKRLKGYDYVGVGRTDGKKKGEYSPIFFRKDKFKALEKGNFWLSETPEKAGSVGWDAALERIASYVKLKDRKTGRVFMAVNTHFDHKGVEARRESARLIMSKIQEIVGDNPAVVTGDFNVTESDEAYKTMVGSLFKMNDAHHLTTNHTGATYTWHNFGRVPAEKGEKIDFIFLTPTVTVERTHIEPVHYEGHLSDHNPHWADLEL